MDSIQVNTTIHCQGCVSKLAPHFDKADFVDNWHVDLDSEDKTLLVEGHDLSPDKISMLLGKEGYMIKDTETGFWSHGDKWKRASFNTLNCLIGCSIGDFGMIIFLQAFYPQTSMLWQMLLAIFAGLCTSIALETVILKVREQFDWSLALKTAFGMSFISMVGMELAMNTTDFMITGGKAAFDDPMYWTALLMAMVAGYLAPLPYNYYKLQKFNKACH